MKPAKLIASVLLAFAAAAAAGADPQPPQALRVCADPDNLPFSHENGAGFENRIAQLVAADLGLPLRYEWLPDRRGFVRKTMGANLCDVIIGVPVEYERTLNTAPYYRSTYVWVERARDGLAPASLEDGRLPRLRIGVQLIGSDLAASPPGHVLARRGLTANVIGFPVAGEQPSAQRMIAALAGGGIDAALVWGPQAGYFAQRAAVPLRVRPIAGASALADQRFEFAIAMGVRRGEKALHAMLEDVIRRRQPDIDRILAEYAVPTVGGAR